MRKPLRVRLAKAVLPSFGEAQRSMPIPGSLSPGDGINDFYCFFISGSPFVGDNILAPKE